MKQNENQRAKKLLTAFAQFKKLNWNEYRIEGYKSSEIKLLLGLKHGCKLKDEGMMVSEVSRYLRVTSPTVTQLANGLEENKLIERVFDPTDRRIVRIKLTEKGLDIANKAENAFYETINGLIGSLGEEDSDTLAELLLKVFTYFDDHVNRYE